MSLLKVVDLTISFFQFESKSFQILCFSERKMDPNDPQPVVRRAEGILTLQVNGNGHRTVRVKWVGQSA